MFKNKNKIVYSLLTCAGSGCSLCDLLKTIENIFFWLLSVTFVSAILFVVISGFAYAFSLGKPGLIEKAKRVLKFSIAGFAISLLSWLSVHSAYNLLGYKSDSWWRLECDSQKAVQTMETATVANSYLNEISVNNLGGRNNPVALPDLVETGLANFPENKYLFIYGLGGQSLERAAQQLAEIVLEAKKNGKAVYIVKPFYVDPETEEVVSSKLENLNKYINPDVGQTIKDTTVHNFENWLVKYELENDSIEVPLGIFDEDLTSMPVFNNDAWTQIGDYTGPGLSSVERGVLRTEGIRLNDKVIEGETDYIEMTESSPWTVNLASFYPKGASYPEYYLNLERPLTFNFAPNVDEESAEAASEEIAKVVARSAKTVINAEDDWFKLSDLMAKETLSGESYDPGIFPYAVVKGSFQRKEEENDRFNQELEERAEKIIKEEVGENFKETVTRAPLSPGAAIQEKVITAAGSNLPPIPAPLPSIPVPKEDSASGNDSSKFNKIASLGDYSLTPGGINTDQILSLAERERLYKLVQGIQKEEAENMGKNMNISPAFIMCVMALESKFDVAAGKKGSTHVGLGQMGINETKMGLQELKKYAPDHYKELSDKIREDFGVDMEGTFMGKQTKESKETKLKITRSDPEFAAATTTAWIQKLGTEKGGGKNLRKIAEAYNGGGDANYPVNWILRCAENNGWRQNQEWVRAKLGW